MNDILLTLDIDWAPDFVIDWVAEQLVSRYVQATWFVTHLSPAVQRLQQYPELFELGIHPNFLSGSTHGDAPDAVLEHCMALVPDAVSMRTHGLFQSSLLLAKVMEQTAIITDVSLFLPYTPYLRPVEYYYNGQMLLRIPYYWEDDFEMERPSPCWHLQPLLKVKEGLKVFDFHPIHVYLNSATLQPYQTLKQTFSKLSEATPKETNAFIKSGEGTQTVFMELIEYLAANSQTRRIRDIHQHWQSLY